MMRSALAPALVLAVGLALLVFMVTVEGEPGALPLLLVGIGLGWTLLRWRRAAATRR